MLLSTSPPFMFFAMNKTGSTSVEAALRSYDRRLRRHLLEQRYSRQGHPAVFKHARPADIRELVSERAWDRSFRFCFVRNPYDRLVSLYHYHQQRRPDRHPMATELPFEHWLEAGGSGSALRLMTDFITDDAGSMTVDFVGRFETLNADFDHICQQLGIDVRLPLTNPSRHRHYAEHYTPRARRLVEERFGADLERFSYSFEAVG